MAEIIASIVMFLVVTYRIGAISTLLDGGGLKKWIFIIGTALMWLPYY
jgi:hypothetical protein